MTSATAPATTPNSTSTLPERITEKDIADALDADAIIANSAGNADFKELVDLAGRELMRRFKEEPDSLPGTFVIKLYLDGMKAIAAGDAPDESDPGSVDLLASLEALPPESAIPILRDEMERLGRLFNTYLEMSERLKGATA